jgi:alcohol dehydrogenase class IV
MRFEFATAGRILFGPGTLRELGPAARSFGGRALLVTGSRPGPALDLLSSAGLSLTAFPTAGEPTVDLAVAGALAARECQAELVIAFGGGSALDAGKAIAALATNPGDPFDYLEVVGRAQPLPADPLPVIAIPTTAGTGSEVTRNAVLASPAHGVKASLRHPRMLPRLALVDPELTLALPPEVTAATGLDALTQLIEPFVSSRANPFTDTLCREGIAVAARCLPHAFADGAGLAAREGMSYAALLGGLALANAGLGVVHGFAAPIGGQFPAPHGAVCAALLAPGCETNIRALRARAPQHPALDRYAEIARLLSGRSAAQAEDCLDPLRQLAATLRVPPLRRWGVAGSHVSGLAAKAARSSSLKANPIELTAPELAACLSAAI